jgi:hypothetical protein
MDYLHDPLFLHAHHRLGGPNPYKSSPVPQLQNFEILRMSEHM